MTNTLMRTGARGGGITLLSQAGRMAVQLAGVIVLSRLLTPEDFGLVAMVAVFMTLADLIRDFGLSSAALQAKDLGQQQASNLFWASWGLGCFAGLLLIAATPLIVSLYDEPRLSLIVPALAITLFVSGAQAQIQVQLARQLKFTVLALSIFVAPTVGLVSATLAALAGLQYWALVIQPVAAALTLLIVQILGAGWRPSLPKRDGATKPIFISGAQMGGTHFLTWLSNNVDSLLAGSQWGAVSLGYYNRSFQLTATMIGGLFSPLTQVAIPMLNQARRDGRNASDLLLKMQFLVVGPVSALMIALALTSPSLIPLLLGEHWTRAIPLVQILALAECFHALSFISYWGFLSAQLSKQLLYYSMVTKPLAVLMVGIGSIWGVEGIAWGYAAGLAVSWPINLIWLSRTAGIAGLKFFFRGVRTVGTAAISYAVSFALFSTVLRNESWLIVIASSSAAILIYTLLLLVFPDGREDVKRVLKVARSLR